MSLRIPEYTRVWYDDCKLNSVRANGKHCELLTCGAGVITSSFAVEMVTSWCHFLGFAVLRKGVSFKSQRIVEEMRLLRSM